MLSLFDEGLYVFCARYEVHEHTGCSATRARCSSIACDETGFSSYIYARADNKRLMPLESSSTSTLPLYSFIDEILHMESEDPNVGSSWCMHAIIGWRRNPPLKQNYDSIRRNILWFLGTLQHARHKQ